MKATIEIPDDLYRQVKAKSALEGRAVREVTEELYRRYVWGELEPKKESAQGQAREAPKLPGGQPVPSWFGLAGHTIEPAEEQDMESIRASIARGIAREREL